MTISAGNGALAFGVRLDGDVLVAGLTAAELSTAGALRLSFPFEAAPVLD